MSVDSISRDRPLDDSLSDNAPVMAIDGPGGAGKGTIAKLIASRLGWHLLDSGKLYRLLALAVINHRVDIADQQSVAVLAGVLDIQFISDDGEEGISVRLEGEDVTRIVGTEEVGAMASRVAQIPAVRAALLQRQRDFAQAPGLVADGRDMGTVVFPAAPLKIYLTASVEERAKRRQKQLIAKGQSGNLAALAEAIAKRDKSDMERPVAPLKPAEDAIIIDSTDLSIDQVCTQIIDALKQVGLG